VLNGSNNPGDYEWHSAGLRIYKFALICFSAFGLVMVVKFSRSILRFTQTIFHWLFRWRTLKLFLKAFAALLFLSWLYFYVEENWRIKRAWDNYRREWETKGERFDFASFVPKPVPDEQNFALTPIVATSYEWMLDKHGHELIPRKTNFVNRLHMKIRADYNSDDRSVNVDYPTNYGNWKIGQKTDLKEFQLYYRALATKTNDFPIRPQPQSPAADVLLALSKYDSDIEELRVAARLPYSRFPLNYDAAKPFAVYLMHLASLKQCNEVLRLRAIAELQNNQTDNALADVKLSLCLIDSIRNEPFEISHLVRIEMLNMTIQPVWEGLAEHKWSDAQLMELDRELAKLDFLADYEFSTRGGRAAALEVIDYMRRTRHIDFFTSGYGSGRLRPIKEVLKERGKLLFFQLAPGSVFYQNKLHYARTFQQSLLSTVNVENGIVSPDMVSKLAAVVEKWDEHWSPNNTYARDLLPGLVYALRKFAYAQNSVDMARVACALERYLLAHNEFPESLDALSPQFIKKVPHDIIGGPPSQGSGASSQPLHYRRAADGKFLLYSIGWNETDDGGVVNLREGYHWVDDHSHLVPDPSDWVWKNQPHMNTDEHR
jgi:hypothetical protein